MSVEVLRPTGTRLNGTSTIGGAPSPNNRQTAVSDDDSDTYVDIDGTWPNSTTNFTFDLPDLDGGVVRKATPRVLANSPDGFAAAIGCSVQCGAGVVPSAVLIGQSEEGDEKSFPAATGDGSVLEVGLWRQASGTVRIYELYLDLDYVAPPEVAITAPIGTVDGTNRPEIVSTATYDSDTAAGTFETKVFTDAVHDGGGFDPGTSTAVASIDHVLEPAADFNSWITPRLDNGTYHAYHREAAIVNGELLWSEWAHSEFTIDVEPPEQPGIEVIDQPRQGRVKIELAPDNSGVDTDQVTVERSVDGGDTWTLIRSGTVEGSSASTLYDYEARSGVVATYRAQARGTTVDGLLYSDFAEASLIPVGGYWLKHPTKPEMNTELLISSMPGRSRDVRQTEEQPLGRDDLVVLQDTPGPNRGSVVITALDADAGDRIEALWLERVPLLLSCRERSGWPDRWIVFGAEDIARILDKEWGVETNVTLPWSEVARPEGEIESWPPDEGEETDTEPLVVL